MKKLKWSELSKSQQEEATKALIHAGWKDPKAYDKIIFQVKQDGSIYGWHDPKFFI